MSVTPGPRSHHVGDGHGVKRTPLLDGMQKFLEGPERCALAPDTQAAHVDHVPGLRGTWGKGEPPSAPPTWEGWGPQVWPQKWHEGQEWGPEALGKVPTASWQKGGP